MPLRLIPAAAVALSLRGATCEPNGSRLIDEALDLAIRDVSTITPGALLVAEVDPRNAAMLTVLDRNGFEEIPGQAATSEYLFYVRSL